MWLPHPLLAAQRPCTLCMTGCQQQLGRCCLLQTAAVLAGLLPMPAAAVSGLPVVSCLCPASAAAAVLQQLPLACPPPLASCKTMSEETTKRVGLKAHPAANIVHIVQASCCAMLCDQTTAAREGPAWKMDTIVATQLLEAGNGGRGICSAGVCRPCCLRCPCIQRRTPCPTHGSSSSCSGVARLLTIQHLLQD